MSKDPDRLPPAELLVTFEAAARHLSFTRAGAERFITQSAVSRQVRALEDHLGARLFRRQHRALALTDEGRMLFDVVRESLQRLRGTVSRIRAPATRQVITLTTTPGLASLWLIPRLGDFTKRHPGVDVRIDASFEKRDIDAEGIDVALRYCSASYAGGTKLFDEDVTPVCSPRLLGRGKPPLKAPADLRAHTLLRVSDVGAANPLQEWEPWLQATGAGALQPAATLTFSAYDDVISAAVLGQGVALGRRPIVDALLATGRLVAPLEGRLASTRAYFLVTGERATERPAAQALAHWLLEQAHR